MGWGADGSAFAVTGALFLLWGAIASSSIVRARLAILVSILVAAAVFITAAFLSRAHGGWTSSRLTWCFVLLPVVFAAFFAVRAVAVHSGERSQPGRLAREHAARRQGADPSDADEVNVSSPLLRASNPAASGTELADLAYAYPELRAVIAANPATPANVLGWLAATGGDGIADAIAARPPDSTTRTADGTPHGTTHGSADRQGGRGEPGT